MVSTETKIGELSSKEVLRVFNFVFRRGYFLPFRFSMPKKRDKIIQPIIKDQTKSAALAKISLKK